MFALGALLAVTQGVSGCNGKRKDETMHNEPTEAPTETQRIQQSATAFAEKKGWKPDQYRIEIKPKRPDGKHVVHLIYLEDLRNAVPGGGQSVELFLDPGTYDVVEVYRFQ
jgi:hypothetical protein